MFTFIKLISDLVPGTTVCAVHSCCRFSYSEKIAGSTYYNHSVDISWLIHGFFFLLVIFGISPTHLRSKPIILVFPPNHKKSGTCSITYRPTCGCSFPPHLGQHPGTIKLGVKGRLNQSQSTQHCVTKYLPVDTRCPDTKNFDAALNFICLSYTRPLQHEVIFGYRP